MEPIRENSLIERLVLGMPRSEHQVGSLQQSDAELVRLDGSDALLAATTDSIVEEIELGLYDDPYLIGWMAVIANVSDLAAVGADPVGLLLSETLPAGMEASQIERLQQGIRDASVASGTAILGGDTNSTQSDSHPGGSVCRLHVGATALGIVTGEPTINRLGAQPGDLVCVSGPLGLGNVFAFSKLSSAQDGAQDHPVFRPKPRLTAHWLPSTNSCG
jgi:thiamine-monophosphate kinase